MDRLAGRYDARESAVDGSAGLSKLAGRPEGFDVLRIVAAVAVLVSHAELLSTGRQSFPLRLGDGNIDLGRIGVFVFFAISGYLVCGSWLRDPHARRFARRRAARVYPGLAVSVFVTAGIASLTAPQVTAFVIAPSTWEYVLRNLLVVPYTDRLPGSFPDNPVPIANGVLWTLGVEVLAYAVLCCAGLLGLLNRPAVLVTVALLLALLGWRLVAEVLVEVAPGAVGELVVPVLRRVELLACFAAGAALRSSRWTPPWWAAVAAGGLVALVVALRLPLSFVVILALCVIVVYVGSLRLAALAPVLRRGDPSYGMYIYGYAVQQLLVWLGVGRGAWGVLATVSVAVLLALGYASWYSVESPVLRRWSRERRVIRGRVR